ncbi:acyltransferase family protein [Gemmobacter serpentinus]|uniref:acyltransferase family protein n=1 Tax=Gemmobacter serpentinus TaxID=2652247 RepID=UPI00124D1A6B|nr:acyltransferase family protein [Gemmobacter serpentinus]
MSAAGRSRAVDLLKLLLALMVVGIHANPFRELGRTAMLITGEGLYRLAVPIFLLLNGYFLQAALTKGRGLATLRRAVTLYLIWMALYLPIYWTALMAQNWWQNLRMLVFGYWHLWYLSGMALATALILPIARWSPRHLALLAAGCLGLGLALFYGQSFDMFRIESPWWQDPLPAHRNALTLCLPYMLIGMLIRRLDLAATLPRGPVLMVAMLAVFLVPVESLAVGYIAPRGIAHDTMLSLTLAAPALMIAALQWPGGMTGRTIGDYASGIYFLHVAFVALLLRHTFLTDPAYRPAVWSIAVLGSCLGVWALRRSGLAARLL